MQEELIKPETNETLPTEDQSRVIDNSSSEEVQAVVFLKQAVPHRQKLVYEASNAVLRRVSAALDEHPFNEEPFRPTMGEEEALYNLALQITNAKFILFQTALKATTFSVIRKTLSSNGISEDIIKEVSENITSELKKASLPQEEQKKEEEHVS